MAAETEAKAEEAAEASKLRKKYDIYCVILENYV
jgi:hypothetical protein